METLRRLDDALLAASRADRVVVLMRRFRRGTVLIVGSSWLVTFALAWSVEIAPRLMPAWGLLAVISLIAGVLLALAIADDHDAAGLRGGSYGLLFLVTGGIFALVWALDRRLPAPPEVARPPSSLAG